MEKKVLLCEKSKDELIDIILEKEQEIEKLKKALKEQEKKKEKPKFVKINIKKRRRKPGRKIGHAGHTRRIPTQIDKIEEQKLTHCPDCRNRLSKTVEVIEHIQEDIVPAIVKVVKYKKHRYWCKCCSKIITAPCHDREIPRGYLGPNILIQTAILKYYHCLPYRKIAELMEQMTGLRMTSSAIAQSLQRLSEWLQVEEQVILEAIRGSPQVHIDETGWRLNGKNHWLWAFINKRLAYYTINLSRGRSVVKKTLTDKYNGTIISDFYGVYFNLPYKRQKCLVHLLRELHQCSQRDHSKAYQQAYKKIKRIIHDAVKLKMSKDKITKSVYVRRSRRIKLRLFKFMCGNYRNKNLKRISKRFSKYWLDMLTFLQEDDVDWNNNLAERMIRPNVIYRNRSFGNRSDNGSKAHSTMMSIIQSLLLQEKDVFSHLKLAYLKHRHGNGDPILF